MRGPTDAWACSTTDRLVAQVFVGFRKKAMEHAYGRSLPVRTRRPGPECAARASSPGCRCRPGQHDWRSTHWRRPGGGSSRLPGRHRWCRGVPGRCARYGVLTPPPSAGGGDTPVSAPRQSPIRRASPAAGRGCPLACPLRLRRWRPESRFSTYEDTENLVGGTISDVSAKHRTGSVRRSNPGASGRLSRSTRSLPPTS